MTTNPDPEPEIDAEHTHGHTARDLARTHGIEADMITQVRTRAGIDTPTGRLAGIPEPVSVCAYCHDEPEGAVRYLSLTEGLTYAEGGGWFATSVYYRPGCETGKAAALAWLVRCHPPAKG